MTRLLSQPPTLPIATSFPPEALHRYGCMGTFPTPTAEEDQDERSEVHLRRRVVIELYGASDFESWRECYMVFRTGAIMFEQITPSKLDNEKTIRHFSERYGKSCWPIIYQADVRARLEHAARLRRMGQEAHDRAQHAGLNHHFDPTKPWEWVWGELCMEALGFWHREVTALHALPGQDDQPECPG